MCSATWGRAEALKTAPRGRSTKETSEGLPSEGGTQKNAPTPKHSSSSADKLSNNNRHDGWREWCRWCAAPHNHLSLYLLSKNQPVKLLPQLPPKTSWWIIRQVSVTHRPNIHQQASRGRLSARHKGFRGGSACAFRGCSEYKCT